MITSLIDRLRGSKPRPKADPALNHTYLHLFQAQRQRSFVEVMVQGDDVIYQSMILELDPEERTILIDELFPTGFVGLVGQKVRLGIRQEGGRKLKFDTVITETYSEDGSPLYVLTMPQDVETDQRRSAYRLPIGDKVAIDSHFEGPDHQPYVGRLCNVSSTGLAMEVETENPNSFHYNDVLKHVMFDFAGINIDCGLTVRNIELAEPEANRVLIGAEFVDLPPLEQRVLEKSIMRIQRDRIKLTGDLESQLALA